MDANLTPAYIAASIDLGGYFQFKRSESDAGTEYTKVQLRITMPDEQVASIYVKQFGFGKVIKVNNGVRLEIYAMPNIKNILEYCVHELRSRHARLSAKEMLSYIEGRLIGGTSKITHRKPSGVLSKADRDRALDRS